MSNETQKADPAKTKSARKARFPVGEMAILAVLLLVVMGYVLYQNNATRPPYIQIGIDKLPVEVADDTEEQIRGLSGRAGLPAGTGMLFVFDEPAQQCIWMKDMRFSIDILWLDSAGRIIDVKQQATPESYPEQFCSSDPARYVVELQAGAVNKRSIAVGDQVDIRL